MSARTVSLILVAAGALLTGSLFSLKKAGNRAGAVKCASNLREIQAAWRKGDGFDESLKGRLLVCPRWIGEVEPIVDGRRPALHDFPLSYEWVPWKLPVSTQARALLAFDQKANHSGGRNVVFTDGSVEFLEEAEFQKRLEAERQRFGDGPRVPEGKHP